MKYLGHTLGEFTFYMFTNLVAKYCISGNLAGPHHDQGISVIAPSGLPATNYHRYNPPSHHGRSQRHRGVLQNPDGLPTVHVLCESSLGSMDSVASARSSMLSFLSTGSSVNSLDNVGRGRTTLNSLASDTGSRKSVRLALGGEMTAV